MYIEFKDIFEENPPPRKKKKQYFNILNIIGKCCGNAEYTKCLGFIPSHKVFRYIIQVLVVLHE